MRKSGIRYTAVLLGIALLLCLMPAQEANAEGSVLASTNIYHNHAGSSDVSGGCYTAASMETVYGYMVGHHEYANAGTFECPNCGSHQNSSNYYYTCTYCDYNSGSVDKADYCTSCGTTSWEQHPGDIGPGMGVTTEVHCTHEVVDHYELGCSKDESTVVATLEVNKSISGGDYYVAADLINVDSCVTDLTYLWDNGCTEQTRLIQGNGDYNLQLTYKDTGAEHSVSLPFTVTDYDMIPPAMTINYDNSVWTQSKVITVTDISDNMLLHSEPLRFMYSDGTWTEWSSISSNSIQVNTNGTYAVEGRDAIGNVNHQDILIDHIDNDAPYLQLEYDASGWNTTKTLTAAVSDAGSGISGIRMSSNGSFDGVGWSSNTSWTITSDGTYTVQVEDNAGNVSQATAVISNIDNTDPTVTLSCDDNSWSQTKTINASASDDIALDELYINWGGEWSNINSINVTSNGTYSVTVRDHLGNESSASITVSHIDTGAPWGSVVFDDTLWTQSKSVHIDAGDAESGLDYNPYSFYDGSTWTAWISSTDYEYSSNGDYAIRIKDLAGNIIELPFSITHIDNTSPLLQTSYDNSTWELIKHLALNGSDEESGLSNAAYRFYNGSFWSNWNSTVQYELLKNGTYQAQVTDKAGNIALTDIFVDHIDTTEPEISITEADISSNDARRLVTVTAVDNESGLADAAYSIDLGVTWQESNEFEMDKYTDYVIQVRDQVGNIGEVTVNKLEIVLEINDPLLPNIAIVTTTTAATGGGFVIFFVFWIFAKAKIYAKMKDGAYTLLGKARIKRKDDKVYIKISPAIVARMTEEKLDNIILNFNDAFYKKYVGSEVVVIMPEETICMSLMEST